jgi:flagellar biosynthesis protein FliR
MLTERFQHLDSLLQQQVLLWLLVLTRLSLALLSAPALGAGVPVRVRALFAMALSALIVPITASADVTGIRSPIELAFALVREALIGLLIGLVIQLLIAGMQTVGELANSAGGLQLGDTFDPMTRSSVPVFSRMISMLAVALLLVSGGHRELLDALLGSFVSLPPGKLDLAAGMLGVVTNELIGGLTAGIRASAPILISLLLANLITGLVSRTLPQLNLLAIGLNINALTLMLVAIVGVAAIGSVFEAELMETLTRLRLWLSEPHV